MGHTTKNYKTADKWVVTGELSVEDGGKITVDGQPISGGSSGVAWADVTGKPSAFPPATHTHTASQISDASTVGRSVLTAQDAAAARTAIGASGPVATGTAAQLEAGTDTTPRLFTAKMIHDEIARQIAASGGGTA